MVTTSISDDVAGTKEMVSPNNFAWKKSNRLLRGWITSTLFEELLSLAVSLETSAEVWNTLANAFAPRDSQK